MRRFNDTTHDCDAVCEKLDLLADSVSELDMTMNAIQAHLCRIATTLERMAPPAAQTAGTMA